MKINVITIFPDVMVNILSMGMLGIAAKKSLVTYTVVNPRDLTKDKHRTVDDDPYGGGGGMILMAPPIVLVDGRDRFECSQTVIPVVGGDSRSLAVAAASIIAKVTRDRLMRRLHARYPVYNFLENKGYGTREHLAAICRHGVIPEHRKSYRLKTVEKTARLF